MNDTLRVADADKSAKQTELPQTPGPPTLPLTPQSCHFKSLYLRHRFVPGLHETRGVVLLIRWPVVRDDDVRETMDVASDGVIQHADRTKDARLRRQTAILQPQKSERRNTYGKIREHHLPGTVRAMRQTTPLGSQRGIEVFSAVAIARFMPGVALETERRLDAGNAPKQPHLVERRALPAHRREQTDRMFAAQSSDNFRTNLHARSSAVDFLVDESRETHTDTKVGQRLAHPVRQREQTSDDNHQPDKLEPRSKIDVLRQVEHLDVDLHAGLAENFQHTVAFPMMNLEVHHVARIGITPAHNATRHLDHDPSSRPLAVLRLLIRQHRNDRILPLLDVGPSNLARRATANTQVEQKFPMRVDFRASRLVALRHRTAHRQRPRVRIHAKQFPTRRPTHQPVAVCVGNFRITLDERNPLIDIRDRLPHHRSDLLDVQLQRFHERNVVTALLRVGDFLAPGVFRNHFADFRRVVHHLDDRRHSGQPTNLRGFKATMTVDHALALAQVTKQKRTGYPVAGNVLAQLTERGVTKLLAHGNQRRIDERERHLLHFGHSTNLFAT